MAISDCNTNTDHTGKELVEHGTTAFPVACYHDNFREGSVPWHWHDELEAVVAIRGDTFVKTSIGTIRVPEGDGFFLNTGVLHACIPIESSSACEYHSIVFHARLVGGSTDSVFWQKYLSPLLKGCTHAPLLLTQSVPWQNNCLSAIEAAWTLCHREPAGYEFEIRNQLSQLIFLLAQNLELSEGMMSNTDRRKEDRIKTMIGFIQEHYKEDIRTIHIADSVAISESECLRCFQKLIGTTPNRYLKEYRLSRAEELLSTTGLKITEIGERCGFQEMSYFAKAFREKYGVTPSAYRREESIP
ncbi:MAG: helix-turn-helix transcriptional regulator [Lachnospiraceae bacterium]|nr:helix-turn-helix transcriptional regulator [Lachnospiraceae bacterium]